MKTLLESSPFIFYLLYCDMAAYFISLLFVGYVVYVARPTISFTFGPHVFSWHPCLMTLSFVFFMFQAVLIFSPVSSLLPGASRTTKVRLHWIFQLLTLTFAWLGYLSVWYMKTLNNKYHFTTWHGLLGIVALCYTTLQCCAGLFLQYPQYLVPKGIKIKDLRLYHATSGCLLWFLVCTTLFLGICTSWFTSIVTGTSWYACAVCVGVLASVVVHQVAGKYVPKKKTRPPDAFSKSLEQDELTGKETDL